MPINRQQSCRLATNKTLNVIHSINIQLLHRLCFIHRVTNDDNLYTQNIVNIQSQDKTTPQTMLR